MFDKNSLFCDGITGPLLWSGVKSQSYQRELRVRHYLLELPHCFVPSSPLDPSCTYSAISGASYLLLSRKPDSSLSAWIYPRRVLKLSYNIHLVDCEGNHRTINVQWIWQCRHFRQFRHCAIYADSVTCVFSERRAFRSRLAPPNHLQSSQELTRSAQTQ